MFNGLERQKQRLPSLNFDIRLSISACDGTGAPGKKENDLGPSLWHSAFINNTHIISTSQ